MTGALFILHIKAKLNRLDTAAYQDVRDEEVLMYANDSLKALTLGFDIGEYSSKIDRAATKIYMARLYKVQASVNLASNSVALPSTVLKLKGVEVEVTIGEETGWVPATRELSNEKVSSREDNPFRRSYVDKPAYRFIENKIQFDAQDFTCNKVRYDYLEYPVTITAATTVDYVFNSELEDKTVTLILENLESQRLQTQPIASKF